MAAGDRYDSKSRKLRAHICNCRQKAERTISNVETL